MNLKNRGTIEWLRRLRYSWGGFQTGDAVIGGFVVDDCVCVCVASLQDLSWGPHSKLLYIPNIQTTKLLQINWNYSEER